MILVTQGTTTLRAILAMRGLSHSYLANQIGLSRGTVKNISCGSSPSLRGRSKIENFLGIPIAWPTRLPRKNATGFQITCAAPANTLQGSKSELPLPLPSEPVTRDSVDGVGHSQSHNKILEIINEQPG